MLIVSLGLAVIGLAALVFAVITSNEAIAWVCIGASVIGVILLIIDAVQERRRREAGGEPEVAHDAEPPADQTAALDSAEESAQDEPSDTVSDDH